MTGPRSLGLRSDVMVLGELAQVEDHSDRIVLRTPSEPDFWFGNMVIFRSPRIEPAAQIARFQADLPDVRHITLVWDVPGMAEGPEFAQFTRLGFEIDRCDVLTLSGAINRSSPPDGIEIRPVEDAADWEQVIALQVQTGVADGHVLKDYLPYIRKRFAARQRQVSQGWGRWFGAFDGPTLVGDLGIFVGEGTARFQDVETAQSHRRRGICAALVCAGLDWAARYDPDAVPVIVANVDGQAGRVYRRCGFTLSETLVAVVRPPDGAKIAAD